MKNELTEHPDFSEWDRFANQEYLRLAMEEENQEPVYFLSIIRVKCLKVKIYGIMSKKSKSDFLYIN